MEKSFSERVAEAKAAVRSVSPQEAGTCQANDPNTLFIDPRNDGDIRATTGIIPGALNVPLKALSETADENLPQELASRSRPIITAWQGARGRPGSARVAAARVQQRLFHRRGNAGLAQRRLRNRQVKLHNRARLKRKAILFATIESGPVDLRRGECRKFLMSVISYKRKG